MCEAIYFQHVFLYFLDRALSHGLKLSSSPSLGDYDFATSAKDVRLGVFLENTAQPKIELIQLLR